MLTAAFIATAVKPAMADEVTGATNESAVQIFETDETWSTCRNPLLERPFAPFGDERDYVMAPGASFEDASVPGWQLAGNASVAYGDDPFKLRSGSRLLRLPRSGASAITPAMCVDLHYPTLRFAVRAAEGGLKVEVIYPDVPGATFQQMAVIPGGKNTEWRLTDDVPILPETGGAEPGERRVALRLTAVGGEDAGWRVDDIFVDPRYY